MVERIEAAIGSPLRRQAHEWIRASERYVLEGDSARAREMLLQLWDLTHRDEPRFANAAAWQLAWLLLSAQEYAEAALWFARVSASLADEGLLWESACRAQVRACQLLAGAGALPGVPAPACRAPFEVTCLGSFSLAQAGCELPQFRNRKAAALFRYLLTRHNRTATKEDLAEAFWPDTAPSNSIHSVHVAVNAIRQHLAADVVRYLAGAYCIDPRWVGATDRDTFLAECQAGARHWSAGRMAEAQASYARAAAGYQGDYVVDDAQYVWELTEQSHLLSQYLLALERLGDLAARQQADDQALLFYQRLLDRDEYREDIYVRMMRCFQRLGRRHDALLQYRRCAAVLQRDLGVEPLPETQQIYAQIIGAD